jgi:hypothetical protein
MSEQVAVQPAAVTPRWRPKFALLLFIGMALVGLFVLGGEFRDKFSALFKHRAKVEFAPAT